METETKLICLDGSTLEGGGQLVRNAIALSALTCQPLRITRIRAKRHGQTGLRPSHAAAIQCLLDVCGGTALKATVGSSEIIFYPRGQKNGCNVSSDAELSDSANSILGPRPMALESMTGVPPVQPEYHVQLKTPGSAFLIFQALYPYLLYAGACTNARATEKGESPPETTIRLNVTGGTNVSFSPSYDYVSEVLIPNFAKLGLPTLSVELKHRGWSSGQTNLGAVSFAIEPLKISKRSAEDLATSVPGLNSASIFLPLFPTIELRSFERGAITQIDITILAPDSSLDVLGGNRSERRNKHKHLSRQNPTEEGPEKGYLEESDNDLPDPDNVAFRGKRSAPNSVRRFIENYAVEATCRAFAARTKSSATFLPPKVDLRYSEATRHYSQTYILLVAHTSSGFKLGRDALYGIPGRSESQHKSGHQSSKPSKGKGISSRKSAVKTSVNLKQPLEAMVDQCIDSLMYELSDGNEERDLDQILRGKKSSRFLDSFMRDQVVVFQGLGKLTSNHGESALKQPKENDLSLHTQTAMWVCEQMLGIKV